MIDLEERGIPGVMIASTPFREATRAQGKALGLVPATVFVPHPIQDRTDAEMTEMARAAERSIVTALTRQD